LRRKRRIRAYREAAQTILNIDQSVSQLIRKGQADALRALPHIGEGIAAVIDEYVTSGKSGLLADLEAQVSPEMVFAQVPGIGPTLTRRIVDELHIQT
jgi:DNA polymerase/3'-5' exonuclease PolX